MTISTLKDLYIDQLQDLYSANRQALQATRELQEASSSDHLRSALAAGAEGIEEGMAQIKSLIENHDANPRGEHCKGMEGLVAEARAHGVEADFADEDVRDASIIAQYQRMTHYGISGYGTAAAFARRLGLDDDAGVLAQCLEDTRGGDKKMTAIASGEVNPAAAEA
jgi:ferritin-like metal-binding protein YciE